MRVGKKLLSTLLVAAMAVGTVCAPVRAQEEEKTESTEYCMGLDTLHGVDVSELEIISDEKGNDSFAYGMAGADADLSRDWHQYSSNYVYDRMTSAEKAFFDKLDACCYNFISTRANMDETYISNAGEYFGISEGISYSGLTLERAQDILWIFQGQRPQYYFVSNWWAWNTAYQEMYLLFYDDFVDGSTRAQATKNCYYYIDGWVNEMKSTSSPYEREIIAHDIVCSHITYSSSDWTSDIRTQSMYWGVMDGDTVCAGYSKLFSTLCNAAGIETMVVTQNGCHAWNKVNLYGSWYLVDTTWDDYDGAYGYEMGYDYFNINDRYDGSYDFTSSHIEDDCLYGLVPAAPYDFVYDPSLDQLTLPDNSNLPTTNAQGYYFYLDSAGNVRCMAPDGLAVVNDFMCDGTYTYYFQADGTAMKDRLTYHPDGIHVIYFDAAGHEVFSDFANISKSISGDAVNDMCFFNVYGYMYVDTLTYDKTGTKLYYVNPYGVLERNGWFAFSGHEFEAGLGFSGRSGGYGYANADCSLITNTYTYDWDGNYVYIQGDGHMFR